MKAQGKPALPKLTALIDGDTLIYEACLANERETEWPDDIWTLHGDLKEAREQFQRAIREIQDGIGATDIILALSDTQNWRKEVMPTYKANRKSKRKPVTYHPLRAFCHEEYDTFQRPWLEGDDVLGILATHKKFVPGNKVVVSVDKDMKTIPGRHLNYRYARECGDWDGYNVTVEEAERFHLYQSLVGDAVDGYPGCKGFGPVSADKWFAAQGFNWTAIVAAYVSKGFTEEFALQNARVARILRGRDYDFDKKEVILWHPDES